MKNQLLTLRFPGFIISESCREETERKTESWDTGGLRGPEPDPRAAQALYPPWLRQPSLSDSDHSASSAFPVQIWRGEGGGHWCGHRADDWTPELSLTSLPETCPRLSLGLSSGSVLCTQAGVFLSCPVPKCEIVIHMHADMDVSLSTKQPDFDLREDPDIKAVKPGLPSSRRVNSPSLQEISYQRMDMNPSSYHFFQPLTRL